MNIEATSGDRSPDGPVDASYHLVPYPAGVGFAAVSCSTTSGLIRLTTTSAGVARTDVFQPDSPIYHIQNASAAGNLLLPLSAAGGVPPVALVTFDNNGKVNGVVTVVVALSFPPADRQQRVLVKREVPAQGSTAVHIVFSEV